MNPRPSRRRDNPDQLPPHDLPAEQGILGCCFLAPHEALPKCIAAFGVTQPFFDLRHDVIFVTLRNMHDEQQAIDVITVQARLKSNDRLESIGGIAYLAALPDVVPSAANVDFYIQIVRQKFILRQSIAAARRLIDTTMQFEGSVETMLAQTREEFTQLASAAAAQVNPNAMPPHVKTCDHFGEKYWDSFFGVDAAEPGLPLPFAHENFPMRIRGGELTLLLGETKVGKSTILSWIALHLMHKGMKCFIASMEMKPEITLKIMASQLLGMNKLEDCQAHQQLAARALAWLNQRVVLYDFLGITDWRELIESQRYAAEFMGCNFFITDSMMRLGIMDDDYAQQGQMVMEKTNFCQAFNVHEVLVNHLNKSDRAVKQRSRGSQQLLDNVSNIWGLTRNEKKGEKLDDLWQKRREDVEAKCFDEKKFDEAKAKLEKGFDTKFSLINQRWPGARQNGSIYLWFHRESQQMRSDFQEPVGVNLLDRWTNNQHEKQNKKETQES